MNLERTGYVAATPTTLVFVPQALKTIRSRDARAVAGGPGEDDLTGTHE